MATPNELACMINVSFNTITTQLIHGLVDHERMHLLKGFDVRDVWLNKTLECTKICQC